MLTGKQARFAQLIVLLGNTTETYVQAYDAGVMSREAIHVDAPEFMVSPDRLLNNFFDHPTIPFLAKKREGRARPAPSLTSLAPTRV